MNASKKQHVINFVLGQQERIFDHCQWLTEYYLETGEIPTYRDCTVFPDNKVRHKDAYNQVRNAFKTWEGSAIVKGREIIHSLEVEDETLRKELFAVNKYGLWKRPEKVKKMTISRFAKELSEEIFNTLVASLPLPVLGTKKTVLLSHGNSVYIRENQQSASFTHWVTFPTSTPRKPVYLPVKIDEYFLFQEGVRDNSITVQVDDEDNIVLRMTKTSSYEAPSREGSIGLDWGFRHLFASHDGRLWGLRTHQYLIDMDKRIVYLESQLNKLKVSKKKNKRYQSLLHRVRETVKNEVGLVLNRIEDENWAEIVVESIDFRGKGFSPTMNRLLQHAGRGAVNRKLKDLAAKGVIISKVNPAYTSQECSECGFTARENRKNDDFICLFCGVMLHADTNGAVNILSRRSRGIPWLGVSKEKVKDRLEEIFMNNHGESFQKVLDRVKQKETAISSLGDGVDKPLLPLSSGAKRATQKN